jgi:hypothetical protein
MNTDPKVTQKNLDQKPGTVFLRLPLLLFAVDADLHVAGERVLPALRQVLVHLRIRVLAPARKPIGTVTHNEASKQCCGSNSRLYWYRGVTVLLPGWVIWKYWNCPCKFFSMGSWLVSALSTPNGGEGLRILFLF